MGLSHHECHVLALILRRQPVTAYSVRKALGLALASGASDSPGSAYPVIERLKRQGLVTGVADAHDGRGREQLSCTEVGARAARQWITSMDASELLPEDPWRTRATFLGLVDEGATRQWLTDMIEVLARQQQMLDRMHHTMDDLAARIAGDHARRANAARLAWAKGALALLPPPPLTASSIDRPTDADTSAAV